MFLPEPFDLICVEWEDANSQGSDTAATIEDAICTYTPLIRKTYGLFIGWGESKGRKALILATDDDRSDECPEACGGFIYTPADMIIKISKPSARKKKKLNVTES